MQSLNEELGTVNTELQAKVEELSRATDDMQNLLNSIQVATIFLDDQLKVKRYTPEAQETVQTDPNGRWPAPLRPDVQRGLRPPDRRLPGGAADPGEPGDRSPRSQRLLVSDADPALSHGRKRHQRRRDYLCQHQPLEAGRGWNSKWQRTPWSTARPNEPRPSRCSTRSPPWPIMPGTPSKPWNTVSELVATCNGWCFGHALVTVRRKPERVGVGTRLLRRRSGAISPFPGGDAGDSASPRPRAAGTCRSPAASRSGPPICGAT